MIKKLIIPVAGQKIILLFSVIKELHNKKIWNINNINEISGTSAGAIIAVLLALKTDLQIIEDYFIERPWNKFFPKFNQLVNNILSSGIFDKSYCYKFFDPLFKLQNIDLNITLKEFYDLNKIKLNIYVTNLNEFVYQKFSHDNFPNLSLIDAIYMSSTLPLLCQPLKYNNITYIDGGFFKHDSIENLNDINYDETLIFSFKNIQNNLEINNINTISLVTNIITKTVNLLNKETENIYCKNKSIIINEVKCYDIYSWFEFFNNENSRKYHVNLGKLYANIFITRNKLNLEILKERINLPSNSSL